MRTVVDTDNLLIAASDSRASTTIVTFTSTARRLGGQARHEFHASLKEGRGPGHPPRLANIITIVDKIGCWYNNGMAAEITRVVNDLFDKMGSTRTVTLGTSLGGFGAVMFARRFKACDRAIAFGAHSSVHPYIVPFDTRSRKLRAQIVTWDVLDNLEEIVPHVRYELIYGSDEPIDAQHAKRYADCNKANISIRIVEGASHNPAAELRRQGRLYTMLDELIW